MPNSNANKLVESLRDSMGLLVDNASAGADAARAEINQFLVELQPDIEAGLVVAVGGEHTHLNTLRSIHESITSRLTAIGTGFLHARRQEIAAMVIGAIRAGVRLLLV